jgi:GNAT superfamily N-acetyltransferase
VLEEVELADGTRVQLRAIRHEDKGRLRQIFDGLSARSRYFRFFISRGPFSEAELRYLTEIDGVDHVAILAQRGADSVGVARFVREAPDPTVAEPALAVIDDLHRRGLGRILLDRLAAAARERGVQRFRGVVLRDNRPMLRLLRELGAEMGPADDGVLCTIPTRGAPYLVRT